MAFYGGAITFEGLKNTTIPELYWLLEDAEKIAKLRAKDNVK